MVYVYLRLLNFASKSCYSRRLFAVAAIAISAWAAGANAAPMTLRFDASISNVVLFNQSGLPFQIQLGDPISGKFTFEPIDVASNVSLTDTLQGFDARFLLDSQPLLTTQYVLLSRDNVPVIDSEALRDQLFLACSMGGHASCTPNTVVGFDDIRWGFQLTLAGDDAIFDGADIPNSDATWNALT